MRSFRFRDICLLSQRDPGARLVTLHPGSNLITGANHTGKSSLIRALFETLGASPSGTLERWDRYAVSLVSFSIGGASYSVLHRRGNRALFTSEGSLVVATGDPKVWNDHFSRITGFNLQLGDKDAGIYPADVSSFFMPFYINQDSSWQSARTFRSGRKSHTRSACKDVLDYFCGIRPPEYYQVRAERDEKKSCLADTDEQLATLSRTRARFATSFPTTGPKVCRDDFEKEVSLLTAEVIELNAKQEKLRATAVRQQEQCASLQMQIDLATRALASYQDDRHYLARRPWEKLVCPTCNAEHDETFMDMLTYAEDARLLQGLILALQNDLEEVAARYTRTKEALCDLEENYERISHILAIERGDMRFEEVVDSMGIERALSAFDAEEASLKGQAREWALACHVLEQKLGKLANRQRTMDILERFRHHYASARDSLDLYPVEVSQMGVEDRPSLSGSGGPRSVLAYYSAIWHTCRSHDGSFDIPIVIDSPNQQAQDQQHLPRIYDFIANELPNGIQLILSMEQETTHHFDNVVSLSEQYGLLRQDQFAHVHDRLAPLEKQMVAELIRQRDLEGRSLFDE